MGWGEGLLLGRIWVGIGIGRNNVVEFVGAPFFSLGVKGQLGTFFSLVCVWIDCPGYIRDFRLVGSLLTG